MAEIRIDRSVFSGPAELEQTDAGLYLPEESTSLPEWQGWDRIENASLSESAPIAGLEATTDLTLVLEQLRGDSEYAGLPDLDEKRLLLDVLNSISGKLDGITGSTNSQKLLNFQETLNETLELYQSVYGQQIGHIKG